MRWLGKERFRLFQGQRGFSLVEVLVALGILGLIGTGLLAALDTNARATRTLDEQVVAVNLATTHLEAIRGCAYADTYPLDSITIPPEYSVDIYTYGTDNGTAWVDPCAGHTLQKIIVSVSRQGKYITSICTYRTEE